MSAVSTKIREDYELDLGFHCLRMGYSHTAHDI